MFKTENEQGELARIFCHSTDQKEFCLVTEDIASTYTLGICEDRCKGVGLLGRKCTTTYRVTKEIAKEMEAKGAWIQVDLTWD